MQTLKTAATSVASLTSRYKIANTPTAIAERKNPSGRGYVTTDIPFLQEIGILTKDNVTNFTKKPYANPESVRAIMTWIAEGEHGPMPGALGRALCDMTKMLRRLSAMTGTGNKAFANRQIGVIGAYLKTHGYTGCDAEFEGMVLPAVAANTADEKTEPCDLTKVMELLEIIADTTYDMRDFQLTELSQTLNALKPGIQGKVADELEARRREEIEAAIRAMGTEPSAPDSDVAAGGYKAPGDDGGPDAKKKQSEIAAVLKALLAKPNAAEELHSAASSAAEDGVAGAANVASLARGLADMKAKKAKLAQDVKGIVGRLKDTHKVFRNALSESAIGTDAEITEDPYGAITKILDALTTIRPIAETALEEANAAIAALTAAAKAAAPAAAPAAAAASAPSASVIAEMPVDLRPTLAAIQAAITALPKGATATDIDTKLAPMTLQLGTMTETLAAIDGKATRIEEGVGRLEAAIGAPPPLDERSIRNVVANIGTAVQRLSEREDTAAGLRVQLDAATARITGLETQLAAQAAAGGATAVDLQARLTTAEEALAAAEAARGEADARAAAGEAAIGDAGAQTERIAELEAELAAAQGEAGAAAEQADARIAALEAARAAAARAAEESAAAVAAKDAEIARLQGGRNLNALTRDVALTPIIEELQRKTDRLQGELTAANTRHAAELAALQAQLAEARAALQACEEARTAAAAAAAAAARPAAAGGAAAGGAGGAAASGAGGAAAAAAAAAAAPLPPSPWGNTAASDYAMRKTDVVKKLDDYLSTLRTSSGSSIVIAPTILSGIQKVIPHMFDVANRKITTTGGTNDFKNAQTIGTGINSLSATKLIKRAISTEADLIEYAQALMHKLEVAPPARSARTSAFRRSRRGSNSSSRKSARKTRKARRE